MKSQNEYKKLFLENLAAAFNDVVMLGDNYTLAHYDYYDIERAFPDKGTSEFGIKSYWSETVRTELLYELQTKKRLPHNEYWHEIKADYLEMHYSGFGFLNTKAFLFYLPAWMSLYVNGEHSKMEMFSFEVFRFLKLCNTDENNEKFQALSSGQLGSITFFLCYLSIFKFDSVQTAKQILNDGWYKFNKNIMLEFEAYQEELYIQNFIDGNFER